MKNIPVIIGSALTSLLLGCASTPVVLAPVGPSPLGRENRSQTGQLEVYSALTGHSEGNNPAWYQHTDFYLCNPQGTPMKHVANTVGYYARAPRLVRLPPGRYLVKAPAKDYQWVEVPVVIVPGHTTILHLDDAWRPVANTPKTEVVSLPAGDPVGWSMNATK